jgi:hypothetical protein
MSLEASAKARGESTCEYIPGHGRWRFFSHVLTVLTVLTVFFSAASCALNMGSGSASTDASELVSGTNRMMKIGK